MAFRDRPSGPLGADVVSNELDEFNARYENLLQMLYARLKEIQIRSPGDILASVSLIHLFCFLCGVDIFIKSNWSHVNLMTHNGTLCS